MAKKSQSEPIEEVVVEEATPSLSDAEYERRTNLDVSDPQYINPSLDRK